MLNLPHKTALSILISVFLFAVTAILGHTRLFDLIEINFYNPSILRTLSRETARDAEIIENYISGLQNRFFSFLHEHSVRDDFERSESYQILAESAAGLQSILFLEEVDIPGRGNAKIIVDDVQDSMIFSFSFNNFINEYRGTVLFTVSARALAEHLVSAGRIKIGEDVSVIGPQGILCVSSGISKPEFFDKVSLMWDTGLLGPTPFNLADSSAGYVLISAKTSQGIFYGRLVNDALFLFPYPMKIILLLSVFLTIFLTVFFLLNLRQDPLIVVENRLKHLQISLIEKFYACKSSMDWAHWIRELEMRRDDIRNEVKHGLKIGHGRNYGRNYGRNFEERIDILIDKSWDEMLGVIKTPEVRAAHVQAVEEEILEELQEPEELEELDIAEVASRIEFGSGPAANTEETVAPPLAAKLEIVSPFTSMLSSLEGSSPAKLNDDEKDA